MKLTQRYRRLNIWNRLGAWGSIASIASIPLALVLAVAPLFFSGISTDSTTIIKKPLPHPIKNKNEIARHNNRQAPTIIFRDGKKAIVSFGLTDHIEEEDAPVVLLTCGTAEKARDSVEAKILSSLIAALEKRTLFEVRQNRSEIEHKLVKTLAPFFKKVGLTLDHFSLLEFHEID